MSALLLRPWEIGNSRLNFSVAGVFCPDRFVFLRLSLQAHSTSYLGIHRQEEESGYGDGYFHRHREQEISRPQDQCRLT